MIIEDNHERLYFRIDNAKLSFLNPNSYLQYVLYLASFFLML